MDSTRIRGADTIDTNQEHKKRCFEKLVVRTERMTKESVEDLKCSLKVEVIDDTALIEATAAVVSGFKNSYVKESDVGVVRGLKNPKPNQENDGKKRRNRGSKKQGKERCSMKCVKEKKFNNQVVEDQSAKQKKIPDRNGFKKTYPKVKLVYRRKDSYVQEHEKVVTEKIIGIGGAYKEPESDLKVFDESEQESTIEVVETEPVMDKDDGVKLNPKEDQEEDEEEVVEDEYVCEIESVESKKKVYTREEMEALRFVNEDEQKNKWGKVFDGFSPSVAKEYTSLLSDMNRPLTQRYNRLDNCGSIPNRHAILSMPPVLPFCSSSSYKKIAPIGHSGFRVNFP